MGVPSETPASVVQSLARHGYNAEREAVTLLARAPDPPEAIGAVLENISEETLRITVTDVRAVIDSAPIKDPPQEPPVEAQNTESNQATDPILQLKPRGLLANSLREMTQRIPVLLMMLKRSIQAAIEEHRTSPYDRCRSQTI